MASNCGVLRSELQTIRRRPTRQSASYASEAFSTDALLFGIDAHADAPHWWVVTRRPSPRHPDFNRTGHHPLDRVLDVTPQSERETVIRYRRQENDRPDAAW